VSLVITAVLVLMLDVFVLAWGPVATEYWTVVQANGRWTHSTGASGYRYLVRRSTGEVTDAQLPWPAKPGDRVRIRLHQTRILHLTTPAEASILCSAETACE
jgi:hypothetical protein